jgi:DMSO reductase family type II enzyme chaperone
MQTSTENISGARSQLLQLLALGFAHPVEAFHRVLLEGSYGLALAKASAGAGCQELPEHCDNGDFTRFESDYIFMFQTGRGGKPVVGLNAGDHDSIVQGAQAQGRPEFLLEYSAWYRHFGLATCSDGDANELPDHLTCQLEFAAWLAHLESRSQDRPEYRDGYRRAQRDFLQQRLQPFLEALLIELKRNADRPEADPFFLYLTATALESSDTMLEQLAGLLAGIEDPANTVSAGEIASVNLWG